MIYGFFILSIFVLFFNVDELLLDVIYFFQGRRRRQRLSIRELYAKPPRQIAILIPAYQESQVIGDMLRTTLRLVNYPVSRYHIFVGLYPNDPETRDAVEAVAKQFPNVHGVVGSEPGPTTKAANLNQVWQYVQKFERDTGARFDLAILHDAEDLIHPLSFKLYNYLADEVDMVQIPVLPVLPEPTLRNFFRSLTTSTYADEFSETHLRRMVVREWIGGFVPSAGVGTALSRRAMAALEEEGEGRPFDERALTEDYTMSLFLAQRGLSTRFFLEGVTRIDARGREQVEYIATREVFPNSFWAAVNQKTRWIYGIAFQTPKMRTEQERVSTAGQRFLLFHDRKGKYSNLLAPFVYTAPLWLSRIYGEVGTDLSWFADLTLFLLIGNLVLFLERQLVRGLAIGQYYGWRHAAFGVLLPPLLPLRFLWGGFINFVATWRAWSLHWFGRTGGRPRWAKTEHAWYMPPTLVQATERRLGDLLMERGDITVGQLQHALAEQAEQGGQLGRLLVDLDYVSSETVRSALANLNQTWFLDAPMANWDPYLRTAVDESVARSLNVVPLLAIGEELVVVTAEPLSSDDVEWLHRGPVKSVRQVLASPLTVGAGLTAVYDGPLPDEPRQPRIGSRLVQSAHITVAELVDALQEQVHTGDLLGDILVRLGYMTERGLRQALGTDDGGGTRLAGAAEKPA